MSSNLTSGTMWILHDVQFVTGVRLGDAGERQADGRTEDGTGHPAP